VGGEWCGDAPAGRSNYKNKPLIKSVGFPIFSGSKLYMPGSPIPAIKFLAKVDIMAETFQVAPIVLGSYAFKHFV
jgi:hypothetical protein